MAATTTLSIRVPAETRRWLERFSMSRGSTSSAAARLLEEAKRREQFRGVEFRDTPQGRSAYVQGTRVQVFFCLVTARDYGLDPEKVAVHFAWPLWKVESALPSTTRPSRPRYPLSNYSSPKVEASTR